MRVPRLAEIERVVALATKVIVICTALRGVVAYALGW